MTIFLLSAPTLQITLRNGTPEVVRSWKRNPDVVAISAIAVTKPRCRGINFECGDMPVACDPSPSETLTRNGSIH